jgi:GT2 family glycosyltransferase
MNELKAIAKQLLLPVSAHARVRRPRHLATTRSPSVTVVVPCYNYGRYLPQCVQSVLDQQGVSVEVIIVDDASTDGSSDIARRLENTDPRVKAVCHLDNRGHIVTFNEGLAMASCEYSVLLSADDLLTPGCLARATQLMEQHSSVGMTYGFAVEFADTRPPPARTIPTNWIIWPGHSWVSYVCKIGRNLTLSPEIVFRTSILQQIGYFDARLPHSGDLELCMRAAAVSDVGYVAGADQAYYRTHSENMHHSFDKLADMTERMLTFDTFFEKTAPFTDAANMHEAARQALAREALGHAITACSRGSTEEPVQGYTEFAVRAWPGVEHLRRWRVMSRSTDGAVVAPRLLRAPLEILRNLTYSARWWRRRWVGA